MANYPPDRIAPNWAAMEQQIFEWTAWLRKKTTLALPTPEEARERFRNPPSSLERDEATPE